MFDVQAACRPFSRACAKTGNKIAARMAMIAITTSGSISVNAERIRETGFIVLEVPFNGIFRARKHDKKIVICFS